VRVAGVEISEAAIAAEAQNHPAPDAETAWREAAEALAIRQLLLIEADRLGIAATDRSDAQGRALAEDDARIDAVLEQEVATLAPRPGLFTCFPGAIEHRVDPLPEGGERLAIAMVYHASPTDQPPAFGRDVYTL
jgi:hypothetical protein